MRKMSATAAQGALIAFVALVSSPAGAETRSRLFTTNPAGICQGALPAFETAIRKRPLAIQNEGATTAFITCAFASQGGVNLDDRNPTEVLVYFSNTSGKAVSVSCTGVTGYATRPGYYVVKQVELDGSPAQGLLAWRATDFEADETYFPSGLFSISCGLPPGVAINDSYVVFNEEVGAL